MAQTVQRIKLKIVGSPVKLDATILEMDADGKRLKVRFDGPLEDAILYYWSDSQLVDYRHANDRFFEVL